MADGFIAEVEIEHLEKSFTVFSHDSNTDQRFNNRLNKFEDRLSSFPNYILINILSQLEIHGAAATSMVSRQWHYLWRGVTSLILRNISFYRESRPYLIFEILRQLKYPKLYVFDIHLKFISNWGPSDVESCFRELGCRNVEQITICADGGNNTHVFCVPACLFEIQSLEKLVLLHPLKLPHNIGFQCSNLKMVHLSDLQNFPSWLGTLCSSCPLLEVLDLTFQLLSVHHKPLPYLRIFASKLKVLSLEIESHYQTPSTKVIIDAPSLTNLRIIDSISSYYFVRKPLRLIRALIFSVKCFYKEDELRWRAENYQEDPYMHQLSKFVAGMSSVQHLVFHVLHESQNNLYSYLNSLIHGPEITTFPNLTSLRTTMDSIGLNGWNDLLLSLHCFPNLNKLDVTTESEEHGTWVVLPDSIPGCLASKLKIILINLNSIKIGNGFKFTNELELLGYLLSNATVLEKLCVSVSMIGESEVDEVLYSIKFCKSLFMLPRRSSTCRIEFSNYNMKASSNDFKDGILRPTYKTL